LTLRACEKEAPGRNRRGGGHLAPALCLPAVQAVLERPATEAAAHVGGAALVKYGVAVVACGAFVAAAGAVPVIRVVDGASAVWADGAGWCVTFPGYVTRRTEMNTADGDGVMANPHLRFDG
jgi:hypothetical protein